MASGDKPLRTAMCHWKFRFNTGVRDGFKNSYKNSFSPQFQEKATREQF
jgi:hypothetical protein